MPVRKKKVAKKKKAVKKNMRGPVDLERLRGVLRDLIEKEMEGYAEDVMDDLAFSITDVLLDRGDLRGSEEVSTAALDNAYEEMDMAMASCENIQVCLREAQALLSP